MEAESDGNDDIASIKEMRKHLESRIGTGRLAQQDLIASLQAVVPDLVSSLDLSLKLVSAFNGREYTPTSIPKPKPNPSPNPTPLPVFKTPTENNRPITPENHPLRRSSVEPKTIHSKNYAPAPSTEAAPAVRRSDRHKLAVDGSGSPLSLVRSMVAVCLLERVPFSPIDSSTVLRKLENDQSATPAEKSALLELGGESGAILAVEMALRSMADEYGGVELEEFVVGGKSRVLVLDIDRSRLVKELPESSQQQQELNSADGNQIQPVGTGGSDRNGGVFGMGGGMPRRMPDMWLGPAEAHLPGLPPVFTAAGSPFMGPRGGLRLGMMGLPRGMGVPPLHRPPLGGSNSAPLKPRTEEDDLKDLEADLEALLNKKSVMELQKSKTGEELLDLIHRPTAKETAVAAKFKTKGGSQLKEYCSALTKEDCWRQSASYRACEKVHFRRIIALHTDINLGDCSFLDTCRHMKTCKYVHYELDPTPDMPAMMLGAAALPPPKLLKPQRAEYCSEVELGEPQWINCDIRNFRMDILGQFGVIMADPPWDIHMELPYGTMADDEMRNLNVPALQTDGLIFLWVTGRAMELGRECLELWGYKRVEEIIWVKTNQLQRIIRTGRTGHWLNHSKEHCLVGIKGNPEVNRNIDTDVIVAEVRETSRKPDEMYAMLERISPRTRKLELFARMHNTHAGWMSLGNQLNGVRLVDEGLRARFKAAYSDVEVQPPSPPKSSAMEVDSNAGQYRSPFAGVESKSAPQFVESSTPEAFASGEKPISTDVDMIG
ncbi:N6-adenosine-methyltransferase MT-A70-like [Telopea speciosissima]|uniref:N6-adenosine-methyltransferase MT-A70-like n=1 Tax=Telopea speciosissima TaxID=54955 RepID=UPI001CC7FC2D|nr:N6-adenosine-methyltransferase MT-A70-like [Telopea speciosissima]